MQIENVITSVPVFGLKSVLSPLLLRYLWFAIYSLFSFLTHLCTRWCVFVEVTTCARLLEALGAPLMWCSANHFGIFRVKKRSGLTRGTSALEQVHEAGYTAGEFEDILASLFATMARLQPVSVIWSSPSRTGHNRNSRRSSSARSSSRSKGIEVDEPLHQALGLVVAQLHGQPSSGSLDTEGVSKSYALPVDVPWRVQSAHKVVRGALATAARATPISANNDASSGDFTLNAWYLPGFRAAHLRN